jgi:hypothetical protein
MGGPLELRLRRTAQFQMLLYRRPTLTKKVNPDSELFRENVDHLNLWRRDE